MGAANIKAAEGDKRFYVYILLDYRGVPRYVGKGTGNRCQDMSVALTGF